MADSIEDIIIEIESDSSAAVSQIDTLTARLQSLKKATGNSSVLSTFSKNLDTLNRSLNFMNSIDSNKVHAIRNMAAAASAFKGVTISKSIGEQITKINESLAGLTPEGQARFTEFVETIMPLNQLKGFRYPQGLNTGLAKTAKLAEDLKSADFTKLHELVEIISQLNQASNADGSGIKEMASATKSFAHAADTANKKGRNFGGTLAGIKTKTVALYMVLRKIQNGALKAMTTYGDYVESLNLYKMALGEAAKAEYEFAEEAQRILGIDLTQWMKAQGVFSALASGFGVASDKAALMSRNLTQLAYDISSFYNIDVETAIEKVQSGFAGQIRPVRNLGYDLSQTRLQAIALANGIDKDVQSMSQAEKSQLRYVALLTQLTEVQGDLARTIDSPINQMRLLNAQIDQMQRSIGMVLLPILNKLLPYLNAIFRVIRMIADEIAAMFGYTLPRIADGDWSASVSLGAEDLEEDLNDATDAAEKLKNTLASFDQINLITSTSGGSGSGKNNGVGGTDLGIDLPSYDFFGDVNENKAQEIANKMMKAIRPVIDAIKGVVLYVVDNLDNIILLIETIAAVNIGKNLVNKVAGLFNLTKKELEGVSKTLNGLGLVTIGLAVSFVGGKDLAKGKLEQGILESALGGAVSALGGYMVLGPAGAVIGLATSVVMTFEGYRSEKLEQLRKRINDDFMKLFPDQTTMDELSKSWSNFLERFYNPKFDESNSAASKTKQTVQEIGESIVELQLQYATGTVTAANYATNLEIMYGQMEDAVKNHLDATGQAITDYLNGPFGEYLRRNGYVVEEVEKNIAQTTEEITEQLEKNRLKLQELDHQYAIGKLSKEDYLKATKELLGPMQKQYELIGLNTDETNEFIEKFNNLNLNFGDWDSVTQKLKEIKDGYEAASKSIDDNAKDAKEWFALYRDSSTTEEMRSFYQTLIDEVDNFTSEQHRLLEANYQDILESIESSGTLHWERVFNTDGLEDTHDALYGHMKDLEDQLSDMYGGTSLTRNETYWTSLMSLMNQFDDAYQVSQSRIAGGNTMREHVLEKWGVSFGEWSDKYKIYLAEQKEATRGLSDAEKKMLQELREKYGLTANAFKKYTNDGSYYASLYEKNMEHAANSVKVYLGDATEYMDEEMSEMVVLANRKVKLIGDTISDPSWSSDSMQYAVTAMANVMGSPSVLNSFMSGADRIMNSVSSEIVGNKDTMQKAYMKAMTMPTSPLVEMGGGLGLALAKGIKAAGPEIEKSTRDSLNGATVEFNRFGEGLAKYLEEIAKGFTDAFSAGAGFFAQTSTVSYTAPKIKTPKIRGYASGGFPNSADFFYANENGKPEFVGTMGGRTAVANNQEITKGVADGVYKAIKETGLLNDVKRIASKNGSVVFAPSAEAGKVMTQSADLYNGTGGRY